MKKLQTNTYQTCLVAGGAGFIGSHLCDRLISDGYEVFCYDNLITGSYDNIRHLIQNPRFHFAKQDISKKLNQVSPVNFIYHLASPASPVWYQRYPIETLLANTYGTYQLLELAKREKAKFLFTSTSEVYGEPKEHPQKETYAGNVQTTGPRSCYDESKRCGESYVITYFRKFSLDARIVRLFNTFGPRMQKDDGRVVSNFISQAIAEKPMTIYGDGMQTRSFCYISDIVEGLVLAMMSEKTIGTVTNLGNDKEFSIKDIASIIAENLHKPLNIEFLPLPEGDPTRRRPDITLAKQTLGWVPKINFNDGIRETIAYIKK